MLRNGSILSICIMLSSVSRNTCGRLFLVERSLATKVDDLAGLGLEGASEGLGLEVDAKVD